MRTVLQIVLFLFLVPICCAFGVFGGCLVSSLTPKLSFAMPAGIIIGIVGGLVVAGLVAWSIRPGRV
jgi:hypothetical protein